jgi:magnesium transporter
MLHRFPSATEGGADAVWIDLVDPSAEEVEQVAKRYDITIPARAELEEIESSSRLRVDHGVLYLSMPIAVYGDDGEPVPAPVGFVLSPKLLVTIRYSEPHAFKVTRSRLEKRGGDIASAEAFTALLEATIDFGADLLEKMAADLAVISKRVFRPPSGTPHQIARTNRALRAMLAQVGNTGEHLSYSRETILSVQRIIGFTSETANDWLQPEIQSRFKTARADLASLSDFETHLSGKVQFLLDAILGFINTEQNDIFKVLTIVSVVGIPPTLIASMYGMNFHNMPEYAWAWGYQYVLALIALSIIAPMAWFKWRGWW